MCSGGFYFSMTSFIIHLDSLNLLDKLSDEQAGQLFKAIRNYQNSGELPSEFWLQIALEPFVNQFTRDAQKYAEISAKRSELGRKGGLAKASNSYQKLAKPSKPSYNDSDSKSNSDSKNDSSNANALSSEKKTEKEKLMLPHSSDEFKSAWESLLTQKKWKNKSDKALQIALKKLGSKAEKVAVKMIENAPHLKAGTKAIRYANGGERIELLNGATLDLVSDTRDSSRGRTGAIAATPWWGPRVVTFGGIVAGSTRAGRSM